MPGRFSFEEVSEEFFVDFFFVGHSIWHQVVTLLKESHKWWGMCGGRIVMVEYSVLPQTVPQSHIAFPVPPLFPTFPLSVTVWGMTQGQLHHLPKAIPSCVSFCISWDLKQILNYYMCGEFLLTNLPVSDTCFGVSLHNKVGAIFPAGLQFLAQQCLWQQATVARFTRPWQQIVLLQEAKFYCPPSK